MLEVVQIGVTVGVLYGPLALGIYLALGALGLPDLTLEGAFGVGGAVAAVHISGGGGPIAAIAIAVAAGSAAGLIAAMLHVGLRINVLLAGLLMVSACWSASLIIMGTSNVPLAIDATTVFTWGMDVGLDARWSAIAIGGAVSLALVGLLTWFLGTAYGLSMRGGGMSVQTARSFGIRTEARQVVGLMLANALAALSGALVVQYQGFMDVSTQVGIVVVGLAAMMIGLALTRSTKMAWVLLAVFAGVVVYRVVVGITLDLGIDPNYVRAVTAGVVVVMIAARSHAGALLAFPGSAAAARRRRERHEFYENDHVVSITK